jgi:hypothetical protein
VTDVLIEHVQAGEEGRGGEGSERRRYLGDEGVRGVGGGVDAAAEDEDAPGVGRGGGGGGKEVEFGFVGEEMYQQLQATGT